MSDEVADTVATKEKIYRFFLVKTDTKYKKINLFCPFITLKPLSREDKVTERL